MQAIELTAPKTFRWTEIPEPADPGPGEVLVQTHRCGICGTDISGYLGKMPFFEYPRIPGHELGVEVLKVGEGVTDLGIGDRCSVEPYINCGHCYACRKGAGNCCENIKVLGVMIDGGLRPRLLLPARKLHRSTTLSFEQLALVETLAIGHHAVQRGGVRAGEHCLVIGAGPIGLATLEFIRLQGGRPVVMDLSAERIAFCREAMGIETAMMPGADVEQQLRDLNDGQLPEVVIDATGHNGSMSASFSYVAPIGRVVFVGLSTDEVTFRHPTFHKPEGTLLCSRNALPDDFRQIISFIEQGEIDTDRWITHRLPFDAVADRFEEVIGRDTCALKAMIEVS